MSPAFATVTGLPPDPDVSVAVVVVTDPPLVEVEDLVETVRESRGRGGASSNKLVERPPR
jgi:hypothetical protein